ncbi:MAG: V-type ATP synthase subunit C [Methanomicrobiales archaeon]|nr:V-type ATP synthase subunit C [Methanomicrobiales archaeon]
MDIGYVNARVRGMHSYLLPRKSLDNLVLKPDIESFIEELEKTLYREDLERALVIEFGVRGIENALRNNLIRTFRKIFRFVEGDLGEKYVRIFLRRWDIHNIKTILRGKKIQISSQEIRDCLVPAGELDEVTLRELLKQPDVKAVIDLLATWGHDVSIPLTRNFEKYSKSYDLVILEYALDEYYYEWALSQVSGRSKDEEIIRNLIATEIDVTNIKTIFSLQRDSIDPEDGEQILLLGGKFLERKKLVEMLGQSSFSDLFSYLQPTPYRFLEELKSSDNRVKMSAYQNALDAFLIRQGASVFRGDPLSITIIIGYLWAKYNEIINLRIIARCKSVMVTLESLEAELTYV